MLPQSANALNFYPTESEWATWPDYCRARYVVSGAGSNSEFVRRVSPAQVESFRVRVGDEAWYWLHHYCAALAYVKRSRETADEFRSKHLMREAEVNFMGQYARISPDNWMFPQVAVSIAQMHRQNGDVNKAMQFLNEAMQAQPSASAPYVVAAVIYRDANQFDKAIEVLVRGSEATDGQSAEIEYVLGLTYIEVNDLDSAVVHARQAYRLGYPLPGLARKLKRAGRTLSAAEEPVANSKDPG